VPCESVSLHLAFLWVSGAGRTHAIEGLDEVSLFLFPMFSAMILFDETFSTIPVSESVWRTHCGLIFFIFTHLLFLALLFSLYHFDQCSANQEDGDGLGADGGCVYIML
jgi:hypothetical protein